MKKVLITLAIAVSSFSAAFAGEEVSAKVLGAFNREFSTAQEITWTVADHYYQATFRYHDHYVSAYYSTDGELIGLTRNISPTDLPLALQSDLKKNHADFWITGLFEVSKDGATAYYLTLEDADTRLVMRSVDGGSWENYKKVKKA